MEHEYYSGISLAIMVYVAVTKLGPKLAEFADKEIDVSLYWFSRNFKNFNSFHVFRELNPNGIKAVQIQSKN